MKMIFSALVLILAASTVVAKPFRVVSEHLPPHQISEKGKLTGGSAYLIMKEVLKRADYDVPMEVLPWARAYKTALQEENVIIFSLARSPERETKFKWIGKLNEIEFNFYALAQPANTNQTTQLSMVKEAWQYNIVAVRNSISSVLLQRLGFVPGENLTLGKGIAEAVNMLRKNRADFIYTNSFIAHNMNTSLNMQNTPLFKQPLGGERTSVYVAASLGTSDALVNNLSNALKSIKTDGTYDRILSQQHPVMLVNDKLSINNQLKATF